MNDPGNCEFPRSLESAWSQPGWPTTPQFRHTLPGFVHRLHTPGKSNPPKPHLSQGDLALFDVVGASSFRHTNGKVILTSRPHSLRAAHWHWSAPNVSQHPSEKRRMLQRIPDLKSSGIRGSNLLAPFQLVLEMARTPKEFSQISIKRLQSRLDLAPKLQTQGEPQSTSV